MLYVVVHFLAEDFPALSSCTVSFPSLLRQESLHLVNNHPAEKILVATCVLGDDAI